MEQAFTMIERKKPFQSLSVVTPVGESCVQDNKTEGAYRRRLCSTALITARSIEDYAKKLLP